MSYFEQMFLNGRFMFDEIDEELFLDQGFHLQDG